jgi:cell division protein FtsZ
LVVGIATKPFTFEGERRRRIADTGIQQLKDNVDTLITIPNDRLLQMIDRKTSLLDAFGVVDEVLQQGVQGISDLITVHGLINLDFADIKAIMSNAGSALMGIGRASGENRAIEAARQAIDSPLLEVSVDGAKGVLFNVTGGRNMSMHEIDEAAKTITGAVDPDANIIFGAVLDETLDDDIKITVVATGFEPKQRREVHPENKFETPAATAEPAYRRPSFVTEPERKPFINERPHSFFDDEDEEEVAPVASIEPEVEEEDFFAQSDHRELVEPEIEPIEEPEPAVRSRKSAVAEVPSDDELDVPAFIRRKVE